MCDCFSRREFVTVAAAGLVASQVLRSGAKAADTACKPAAGPVPPARIRKIYLAKPVPSWPKPDLDVADEMRTLDKQLQDVAGNLAGIQFEGGDLYRVVADVPTTAAALGHPDALLVYNLTSTVGQLLTQLAGIGLPIILFSQPYSGHDWSTAAWLRQKGHPVICLATTNAGEIAQACRLIRAAQQMRHTRVLYVDEAPCPAERADKIKDRFGAQIISVKPDRIIEAFNSVSEQAAGEEAHEWVSHALKVVEPSEREIVDAGKLYLALRKVMQEESAQAVTINCLGLFARKRLPAYPCLAYCRMNDLGLVGVCEADLDSTLTQLLFTYAFGIPGFVSDPVFDTASNTVIHAHCVSATRMDGPTGARAPYIIRSHLEDNKGAALQVRMRIGQVITCAKLINTETMLISKGTIIDNPDVDRGCRTKITTQVADARKFLNSYTGGLHRVIFYGDHVNAIEDLGAIMRFKVVQEC